MKRKKSTKEHQTDKGSTNRDKEDAAAIYKKGKKYDW